MNECENRIGGACSLASHLAETSAATTKDACEACEKFGSEKINRVIVSLAVAAARKSGSARVVDRLLVEHAERFSEGWQEILAEITSGAGPGSQLWRLLQGLGIQHKPGCKCAGLATRMNTMGPAGCRRERDEICKAIRANLQEYGWGELAAAAARALAVGLAWRINLADPIGSVVDEAINLAERAGIVAIQSWPILGRLTPPVIETPPAAQYANPRQKLRLACKLCPGDLLTMTAAIESLHLTYPGEYQVDVQTPHRSIWDHNPRIEPFGAGQGRLIEMHYPSIQRCNEENIPFLAGYTEHLGQALGRPLRLRVNRPHLYLSPEEAGRPLSSLWQGAPDLQASAHGKPIWLVNAGIKKDYTCKAWPIEYFQEVINRTKETICWVQIGLRKDLQPDLENVINLMDGQRPGPPMRETILLASRAAGGLGPVTFLQHLMAAWQKPYICLVGGREPATWVQYPHQHTLHTVGQLDCCRAKSCWKARVVKLNDGDDKDKSFCAHPVTEGVERPAAGCMAMIQPLEVLALLERLT